MISPRNEPASAETWFTPRAKPRRSGGKASVMIAVELAISMAPPTPWTMRETMISSAPAAPLFGHERRSRSSRG